MSHLLAVCVAQRRPLVPPRLTVGVEELPGAVPADGGHAEAVGGGAEVEHAGRVALQLEGAAQLVEVARAREHHLPHLDVRRESCQQTPTVTAFSSHAKHALATLRIRFTGYSPDAKKVLLVLAV